MVLFLKRIENIGIALIVTAVKWSAEALAPLGRVNAIIQGSILLVTHSEQGCGSVMGSVIPTSNRWWTLWGILCVSVPCVNNKCYDCWNKFSKQGEYLTCPRICVCSVSLCGHMDCSPQGSFVHGIFQAKILEWLPFPSPGDLPNPGIKRASPAFAGRFFTTAPPGKPHPGICKPIVMLRHTVLSSGFHFDHQHMDKSAEQVSYTCGSSSLNFTVRLNFWELTLKLTPRRSLEEETDCLLNATDIHISWRRKTAPTHCSKTKSPLLRTCRGAETVKNWQSRLKLPK